MLQIKPIGYHHIPRHFGFKIKRFCSQQVAWRDIIKEGHIKRWLAVIKEQNMLTDDCCAVNPLPREPWNRVGSWNADALPLLIEFPVVKRTSNPTLNNATAGQIRPHVHAASVHRHNLIRVACK
ncbi:MAG TPA: hypothetical protein VHD56_11700 [Tepidisphaeraceae bacterium]|nr:hypothetical protein [Tepidisphaeraceae bacterium]